MFILGSPVRAIVEGDDVDSYENGSSEFSTVIFKNLKKILCVVWFYKNKGYIYIIKLLFLFEKNEVMESLIRTEGSIRVTGCTL